MNNRSFQSVGVWSLVGNTPVLPLHFVEYDRTIWVKCEFMNPSGSIKDRVAAHIIDNAECRGILKPDSIIVECSSGNTGISMAMIGVAKGYRVQILLPTSASPERRWLIRQLGGEVILVDSCPTYETVIELAREMAEDNPRIFLPSQFENVLNVTDHFCNTGQELLRQLNEPIGLFVSGYGTGGTLAGVGKALQQVYPDCQVWAMEPDSFMEDRDSCTNSHVIEGVSQGFKPDLIKLANLDGHITVTGREACDMAYRLSQQFGLLVGTSSGANVAAALSLSQLKKFDGAIVTMLCDRAERYYTTPLFKKSVHDEEKLVQLS